VADPLSGTILALFIVWLALYGVDIIRGFWRY
jgi:hypothetical protein